MAKYKDIEMKLDETVERSQDSGKKYGFDICVSDGKITTTNIEERDKNFISSENECQGTKGSFLIHPASKDAKPSPKDTSNIQTDVPKV